jgi:DNA polymerase-4
MIAHDELEDLSIAHIDCDAFYAAIEKRDNPAIADKPVIVGGRERGVVSACCYIARIRGVHSAMPMFQALKACPDAVVIPPNMAKYREVGLQVRDMMRSVTPLVEPLSIDEAFLDLGGTAALHHGAPARTLAGLIKRIEAETGVTASVGLSYNKFLAKTASDLDKPRGFSVIGRAEAESFLAPRPVGSIYGVGKSLAAKLARDGIRTVGQLRRHDERYLVAKYGSIGHRLARLSRGEDDRGVDPRPPAKSVSAETTFAKDLNDPGVLAKRLWRLAEKVSKRLKAGQIAAGSVTLKLKTSSFRTITRTRKLSAPTQLAENLYQAARPLLNEAADGRRFRLIGIGTGKLADAAAASDDDFFRAEDDRSAKIESAMDKVRNRFGDPAIFKGRSLPED